VSKDSDSKSRTTLLEAIATLKTALDGFLSMQSYAKAKDVVYLMVSEREIVNYQKVNKNTRH
jgi:hypothetical protein